MEQIFFLILLGVVALVRWLSQVAENKKNAEAERRAGLPQTGGGAPPTQVQRAPADTEEERIRRFMEALGMPTTSTPPPPVQPRKVEPAAPPANREFQPIDPFPRPQIPRAEQPPPPAVPTTPAIPAPPAIPAAPPSRLPTRETTVFAEPIRQRSARSATASEFEVQDVTGVAVDDLPSDRAASSGKRAAGRAETRGIAARLATAQGLRDAVVLREIFGPPRSMQPIDRQTVG
jgi:hypothetical protein